MACVMYCTTKMCTKYLYSLILISHVEKEKMSPIPSAKNELCWMLVNCILLTLCGYSLEPKVKCLFLMP